MDIKNKFPTYEIEDEIKRLGYMNIAGVDEVARGTLVGSVVAAAVIIPDQFVSKLMYKVNDSKKLSAGKRDELYDLITNNCNYGIGIISNEIIDEINIFNATKLAMKLALDELGIADYALIDGNAILDDMSFPQQSVIKGDNKSVSVASASIPYYEEIYCVHIKTNCLKRIQIGDLYRNLNYKDYNVFSFDPVDYKIKRYPITGIVKHPPQSVVTLKLKQGKNINASPNHSIFKLKGTDVVSCAVKDLKPGNFIAVTDTLPFKNEICAEINLFAILKDKSVKNNPIFVTGEKVQMLLRDNIPLRKEIILRGEKEGYCSGSINDWAYKKIVPIQLIPDKYNKLFMSSQLKCKSSSHKFDSIVKISEEFAWLLGLYVAEGNKKNDEKNRVYYVNISNIDPYIVNKVKKLWHKLFKLSVSIYKGNIVVSSKIMVYLFEHIGINDYSQYKNIPDLIFMSNKEVRKSFLSGYIDGDGWTDLDNKKCDTWSCKSVSINLIKDLEMLALSLNKATSIYEFPYRGEVRYILGKPTTNIQDTYGLRCLSNTSCNTIYRIPIEGLKPILISLMKYHNINIQNIKDILHVDLYQTLYGATKTIKLSTLNKLINKYPFKGLKKLANCDIRWQEIANIENKKIEEYVYDIEVRPEGEHIENFVGSGGILLHNSIIAKVTKDRIMNELHKEYPEYLWCDNKGYGTEKHIEAIERYGITPYHRKSFGICRTQKQILSVPKAIF
jgi:ribonuclease HII/intein/homing endonuclease